VDFKLKESPIGQKNNYRLLSLILGLSLVVALGAAYYFYATNIKIGVLNSIEVEDVTKLRTSIERLLVVDDKKPAVIVISDIENLRQQNPTLYAHAENDDIMFVYTSTVVIYRPELNKIVTVVPLIN
jgi:hypothetical protein